MSSTTSSPSGLFSSPRRQQLLMWVSGAVLVVGVAVFLVVFLSRGTGQPAAAPGVTTPASTPAATTPANKAKPESVPASSAALQVARTFVMTAVQRKNPDASYAIVGPNLKGGLSLAQWRKGNIPVTFYPASDAKTAQLQVKSSHKNQLMLQVGLHARPGSGVTPKALAFTLGLQRVGNANGKASHWIVNYFVPNYGIKVKANPYTN